MSAPFFAHIGFGNLICANRVLGVVTPGTRTTRLFIERAKKDGTLIDVTKAKTTKSVILMDTGEVVLSHISPDTLKYRLSNLHRPETFRHPMKKDPDRGPDDEEDVEEYYDDLFPDEEPENKTEEDSNEQTESR